MILEFIAVGAAGLALGVMGTSAIAAKLYGWHDADRAQPDAAAWRRGFEAGKQAGRREIRIEPGAVNYADTDGFTDPDELRAKRSAAWYRMKEALESGRVTLGVDLAQPGSDRTVETLLEPGAAPVHRAWSQRDAERAVADARFRR